MKNITSTLLGLLSIISIFTKGQAPTATFTATPNPICAGSCIIITSTSTNTPATWMWYFPGAIPSYTDVTTAPGNPGCITYLNPGIYTASLVVRNSSGFDSVTNTIVVDTLPNLKIYPPSGGICDTGSGNAFDTIYFRATGAATYSWAPAYGLSCTNCPNPNATPNSTTVYTITATSTSGCTSTITDTVVVGYIIAKIWGIDTICPGANDTLLASGGSSSPPGSTYLWLPGGQTNASIVVSPTVTTTYSCQVISGTGGCQSTASFKVNTNCPSAIENITNLNSIEIMPNPATTQLSILINSQEGESSNITLTDITGREIYTQIIKPFQKQCDINISALARGMYFVKLKSQGLITVRKFIKE